MKYDEYDILNAVFHGYTTALVDNDMYYLYNRDIAKRKAIAYLKSIKESRKPPETSIIGPATKGPAFISTREHTSACTICGGKQIWISGKYPGVSSRLICPTCVVDKLERIHNESRLDSRALKTNESRLDSRALKTGV